MAKYRKKPVVVEAVQVTQENILDVLSSIPHARETVPVRLSRSKTTEIGIVIPTLEGVMIANEGDWIITGVQGEHYPCKPDIFEQTYEAVE